MIEARTFLAEGIEVTEGLDEVEALMVSLAVGRRLDRVGRLAMEHLAAGGRRMRARLALAALEALGGQRLSAVPWAAACELLHNAALVHDDLQDGDVLRRGRAAVWVRHGTGQAINTGDLLLMLPVAAIEMLSVDDAMRWTLARTLMRRAEEAVRGQAAELGAVAGGRLGWSDWSAAARGKSGAILALPVEGAALIRGLAPRSATALSTPFETLGVLYQAWDDVLDLFGATGRPPGSDLSEGKPSALVAEHLRLHPEDQEELRSVLRLPRADTPADAVERWSTAFRTRGALDAVLERIRALERSMLTDPTLSSVPDLHDLAAGIVHLLRDRAPAAVRS